MYQIYLRAPLPKLSRVGLTWWWNGSLCSNSDAHLDVRQRFHDLFKVGGVQLAVHQVLGRGWGQRGQASQVGDGVFFALGATAHATVNANQQESKGSLHLEPQ